MVGNPMTSLHARHRHIYLHDYNCTIEFVTIEDYNISKVCSRSICHNNNKYSNLVISEKNTEEDPNSFVYIFHDSTTLAATLFNIHNSCTLRVSEGMWFSNS